MRWSWPGTRLAAEPRRITHNSRLAPLVAIIEEEARRLGLEAYAVGGYVRDRVMHPDLSDGERPGDLDVVVVGGDTNSGACNPENKFQLRPQRLKPGRQRLRSVSQRCDDRQPNSDGAGKKNRD